MQRDNRRILIAYKSGKFESCEGENLEIKHFSPQSVGIVQDGDIIFISNLSDIRYIKFKSV